jgi:hypothetical protein
MTKKTTKRAAADVGLIFTAYNLRRIFNLIDQNLLKQYLIELALLFSVLREYFKALYPCFILDLTCLFFQKKSRIVA